MRTARRYIALEIYRSSAVVLLALIGLFTFFALIEELDNVGSEFTLLNLFYMEVLALPTRLYDLLPIGLLIGAILALASLAQRNELVILRVSGVSGIRLLITLWIVTIPLVVMAFLISEVLTPAAEIKSSEASLVLLGKSDGSRLNSGYWFKETSLLSGGGVEGVTLYELDADQELLAFSQAKEGRFDNGELILRDVTRLGIDEHAVQALADTAVPAAALTHLDTLETRALDTSLTAERLMARVLTPERMSVITLLDYIGYLKNNNLQTDRQVVALWRKVAYPFTLLVMITIAAPISFMQTRRGGVGGKVFIGILLGVGFFMLNQLALNVGMLSKWAPWVTAIVPNLAAWAIALGALLLMENQHNVRRFRQRSLSGSAS